MDARRGGWDAEPTSQTAGEDGVSALNMPNRTLGVMDNLRFLRSLNNECVDLIAIDPPFAANETFVGRPRPPISDAEIAEEKALARKHGVNHDEGRDTRVRDIWSWDADVHPDWLNGMKDDYPAAFSYGCYKR